MHLLTICTFAAAVVANPAPLLSARVDQATNELQIANAANHKLFAQHSQLKQVFNEAAEKSTKFHAAVMLAANGKAEQMADCDGITLPLAGCISKDVIDTALNQSSDTTTTTTTPDVKGPPYALFGWLGRPIYPGYPTGCGGYNPYGCYGPTPFPGPYHPFNFGPGPGKGKTGCGDLDTHQGFICNDAHDQLSWCFKGYYPGDNSIGGGSIVIQKCGFYGGCGCTDDGKTGLCYY